MPRRPICAKLKADANSSNWRDMLAFYCQQASMEDIQMARQINEVCVRLVAIITERARFIQELESVENIYAQKMAEHLIEIQVKDDEKVNHLVTLTHELDLNTRGKDVFVLKLKGTINF